MKRLTVTCALIVAMTGIASVAGLAQQTDTVRIDASRINTSVLIPGIHRYLVYFKNGKDSSRVRYQMWTRDIEFEKYDGRDAISIKQEWESNTAIFHTVTSYCDQKTFAPFYQESWWSTRGDGKFDFLNDSATVKGKSIAAATDSAGKAQYSAFEEARKEYVLNWHLDVEVFATLPFDKVREHTTFLINYYDPGLDPPAWVPYTVTGSGTLKGYDGQSMDCWLLDHKDDRSDELFWISKKTHEVLQLEEQYGSIYRYKVLLPFSD